MPDKLMTDSRSGRVARSSVIALTLAGILWLLLTLFRAAPAYAGGSVTNCGNDTDFSAKLAGGGQVTFNCGSNPPDIVFASQKVITLNTTIDGGGGSARLFVVSPGVALTLGGMLPRQFRAARDVGEEEGDGTGGWSQGQSGSRPNNRRTLVYGADYN